MLKQSIYIILIFSLLGSITSCDDYQKVLKSPNPEYKYKRAVEYYENEEYYKANPLFEELIPLYKGTDKGQKIYYYWCYTNYYEDYLMNAAFHFKKFAKTFPNSEYAEDALFMSAYCNFLQSPNPNLDQTPTRMAIDEMQLFVNTYPNSPLVDSANTLVDRLALKLEAKDFLNSKQYYTIKRYKAAVVALNNFMQQYPASEYEEEAKMLIIKSYYELAINSVNEKKEERFDKGIEAYYDFIDNFADSKKINEAEAIYAKLVKAREEFLLSKNDSNEL